MVYFGLRRTRFICVVGKDEIVRTRNPGLFAKKLASIATARDIFTYAKIVDQGCQMLLLCFQRISGASLELKSFLDKAKNKYLFLLTLENLVAKYLRSTYTAL